MADWHLVVEHDRHAGAHLVWLSESATAAPDSVGSSLVVGHGLTRRAALLSAHKELLAQAARVAYELSEPATQEPRR